MEKVGLGGSGKASKGQESDGLGFKISQESHERSRTGLDLSREVWKGLEMPGRVKRGQDGEGWGTWPGTPKLISDTFFTPQNPGSSGSF